MPYAIDIVGAQFAFLRLRYSSSPTVRLAGAHGGIPLLLATTKRWKCHVNIKEGGT